MSVGKMWGRRQKPANDDPENVVLRSRPSLSIRTRIILSFSLCFILCAAITVWAMFTLSKMEGKIHFLEAADKYLEEIQQARRYEKNHLLYGRGQKEAVVHLNQAEALLESDGPTIRKIMGEEQFVEMRRHLKEYHGLLVRLGASDGAAAESLEEPLRDAGAQIVSYAQVFVDQERDAVYTTLSLARKVPFAFLFLLLGLMVFIAVSLTRQLLLTLHRFMDYTQRIGEGDFTPIMPVRKYRDEFTKLAEAINHMVRELDHRHNVLMESHKLRALGTLVAGVAHELNNPLNNTLLTAASLQEDFDDLDEGERREMVQDILDETERSRKIVKNLLDFARESETRMESLDIGRIVEESVKLVHNRIKMARVRLDSDVAADLPPVHGDEQMLKQVFVNLILNAVEALPPKGHIHVRVRDERDEGNVVVEVEDDGPGIPEHVLPRIFEPFFTTKAGQKGTGLGLAVSQGIVRKLGGYIRVRSSKDSGTVFRVMLPATPVPSGLD